MTSERAGGGAVRVRLTDAQYRLFMEIKTTGGLYIDRWKRYARTVDALVAKELVRDDGEGYGTQHHYVPTEEGWAWTD